MIETGTMLKEPIKVTAAVEASVTPAVASAAVNIVMPGVAELARKVTAPLGEELPEAAEMLSLDPRLALRDLRRSLLL